MLKRNIHRDGVIVPMAALFMIVIVVAVVFAVEIGRLGVIQSELQRAADAAALAGCWELAASFNRDEETDDAIDAARLAAQNVVGKNSIRGVSPLLDSNLENLADGDIVLGRFTGFGDPTASATPTMSDQSNAVSVRVHRDDIRNGKADMGLAKLLGFASYGSSATATAAWIREIKGFMAPKDSSQTLGFLPFAVKKTVWDAFIAGQPIPDDWAWNPSNKTLGQGSDGEPELNIYPANIHVAGNFGTLDVGSANNSTSDIKRQILYGVSAEDLAYLGGKLELGANGTLILNGDTGISASMKDELEQVIGQPRIICLYSQVEGMGNRANFTIVKFVGIRIVEVQLTKNPKRLMVQPAVVTVDSTVIPSTGDSSDTVYSPVILVK